jgi:hypothetical protein
VTHDPIAPLGDADRGGQVWAEAAYWRPGCRCVVRYRVFGVVAEPDGTREIGGGYLDPTDCPAHPLTDGAATGRRRNPLLTQLVVALRAAVDDPDPEIVELAQRWLRLATDQRAGGGGTELPGDHIWAARDERRQATP